MDERAKIKVTLPRSDPTLSYWQDPPDEIADLRSTPELPETADAVIIGSGITGAAVAWHLLEGDGGSNVVMLEARQICSGATGRNGGHTKAASYRSFQENAASLPGGAAAAAQIARLELANIRAVHAFAAAHGIACGSRPGDTVDVVLDRAEWGRAAAGVAALRAALGPGGGGDDPAAEYALCTPAEMRDRYFCADPAVGDGGDADDGGGDVGLFGGVRYPAGSISAYGFTVGVLKLCIERGLKVHANTPAVKLERIERMKDGDDGDDGNDDDVSPARWTVTTPRGAIAARRVVLATNGYTAALQPRFQGVVVPLRGQITAQRAGRGMPAAGLPVTYSFIYGGGYEYMVPRPGKDGGEDIVIGGGLARAEQGGLLEFGSTDDTTLNGTISEYLRESTPRYFGDNWGDDHPDGRVRSEWTGIMGYSVDGYPLVGQVPAEDEDGPAGDQDTGLWASCSFQGHGMVLCWMSAKALVEIMQGRDDTELARWFPDAFRLTRERMGKSFKVLERLSAAD
ncbi:hypothetical protein RB597_006466 [Gaeumannomyces tritici]